jgi:hypothetical protein
LALGFAARPARAGAPAGQISAPTQTKTTQTNASGDSNIEVDNWAKPKPGWLCVLDPKPNAGGPGGRVWLVDPETTKVMGSIRTGDNADFALSPDGSRIYVASITDGDSSELAVIDTPKARSLRGARLRTAKWPMCSRHFQPWRFPAMGWRCES